MPTRRAVLAITALVTLTGCATIMHGTSQDIGISSSPTNAKVTINNQPRGNTPLVAKLSRKDHHIVKLELEGYQPLEATLTRKTSGWVWGNIVFGGLIGLAVDAISGGLYTLTPEQIAGQLNGTKTSSTVVPSKDGLYVILVDRADPAWVKIGSLER